MEPQPSDFPYWEDKRFIKDKAIILAILEDVIDDFNGKWTSHDEVQRGLSRYSDNIIRSIKKY